MKPRFFIRPDSEIPASTQLASQLGFAIASNQYPPGSRLPSTRQLAMLTGLHRNTVSRVFAQLEASGLIEARAGSGMYVPETGALPSREMELAAGESGREGESRAAVEVLGDAIDRLSRGGYSLAQIQRLVNEELAWRVRCMAQAIVTAPRERWGLARLIAYELDTEFGLEVEAIALEDLAPVLKENPSVTLLTSRYCLAAVEEVSAGTGARVIGVDVNDYGQELEEIGRLQAPACVGLVSISGEVLELAEIIIASRRGEDILTIGAQSEDKARLAAVIRRADLVICGRSSLAAVEQMKEQLKSELIRMPRLLVTGSYVSQDSLAVLAREFGVE